MALDPIIRNDDDLAILNLAHETRADDIEGAGFRRQDGCVAQFSKNKRANPQAVAYADKPLSRQDAERVGALDLLQRIENSPAITVPALAASAMR